MSLDRPPISEEFHDAAEHNGRHNTRLGTCPPFSLRLSAEEKSRLRREAGATPLGAYIRSKLLGSAASQRRSYRAPVQDDKALAQLLGELGKARLANNLNQLAKAANSGSLPVTPETQKAILDACREVQWMRDRLVSALGLGAGPS